MKPREQRETGQTDLFRARLDQIINLEHALVRLTRAIDWRFLETQFGAVYSDTAGQPPLPTRLMAGLAILKHTCDLSDEALCAHWLENPYFQYFCGEEFFCHALPFDRSSLTRWRQRMGAERLAALLQESLAVAVKTKALKPRELTEVVVDTTVQEKAVAFPTDARLAYRARVRLVRLARRFGVKLRQSYARVGKLALIRQQRYAHARQFKRAPTGSCVVSRRSSAASCATSRARSPAAPTSTPTSGASCSMPGGCCRNSGAASAAQSSMRCTRRRWSASPGQARGPRARRTSPTSSASRCRSRRRCRLPKAVSSCSPPKHCRAIHTTGTR